MVIACLLLQSHTTQAITWVLNKRQCSAPPSKLRLMRTAYVAFHERPQDEAPAIQLPASMQHRLRRVLLEISSTYCKRSQICPFKVSWFDSNKGKALLLYRRSLVFGHWATAYSKLCHLLRMWNSSCSRSCMRAAASLPQDDEMEDSRCMTVST